MAMIRGVYCLTESGSEISKIPDITTADVLVEFHSPNGSGCHFAHSAVFDFVLKFNGYRS